jgi:hypothetical protein
VVARAGSVGADLERPEPISEDDEVADLPMADRHETVLPPVAEEVRTALSHALAADPAARKAAVSAVVADHPTFIEGWATLSTLGEGPVERYAYARVGYHRGLDALRGSGWGGRGYVRWAQPSNRAFLTCLVRLRDAAGEIGEADEVTRITDLLTDLDPDWDDANVPS